MSETYKMQPLETSSATEAALGALFRGVLWATDSYDSFIEKRRLLKGITEEPEISKKFGAPAERSLAYQTLFSALSRKAAALETWAVGVTHADSDVAGPSTPSGLAGDFASFLLFAPKSTEHGMYILQRQTNDRGENFSLTWFDREIAQDGSRQQYDLAVGDWSLESAIPRVDVRTLRRDNDSLDNAILSGQIVASPNPLLYASAVAATGSEFLSALGAQELTTLVNDLRPIDR